MPLHCTTLQLQHTASGRSTSVCAASLHFASQVSIPFSELDVDRGSKLGEGAGGQVFVARYRGMSVKQSKQMPPYRREAVHRDTGPDWLSLLVQASPWR